MTTAHTDTHAFAGGDLHVLTSSTRGVFLITDEVGASLRREEGIELAAVLLHWLAGATQHDNPHALENIRNMVRGISNWRAAFEANPEAVAAGARELRVVGHRLMAELHPDTCFDLPGGELPGAIDVEPDVQGSAES